MCKEHHYAVVGTGSTLPIPQSAILSLQNKYVVGSPPVNYRYIAFCSLQQF
jgi:hypothetical protein